MEEFTTKVFLPSKGKFNPEHAQPIILDMMGFEEEKIAFGSTTEESIDEVLKRCIKSPENFDVASLTAPDRRFLLIKLRIHTYGDDYHVSYVENGETLEKKISLDDVPVIELPDDFEVPKGTLPLSKRVITLRPLTIAEIRKVEDYARDKAGKLNTSYTEVRYETITAKKIATVDGEEMSTQTALSFLRTLKGRDLAYIDYLNNKMEYGYDQNIEIETKGGRKIKVPVIMTGEFFRPRFDE